MIGGLWTGSVNHWTVFEAQEWQRHSLEHGSACGLCHWKDGAFACDAAIFSASPSCERGVDHEHDHEHDHEQPLEQIGSGD